MTRRLQVILIFLLALAPVGPAPGDLPPGVGRDLFLASLRGETEVTLLAVLEPGALGGLERAVRSAGGTVSGASQGDFAVLRLSPGAAGELLGRRRELGLREVALDRPLGAATAGTAPALEADQARAAMGVNLRAIRADEFSARTRRTGQGITIAVIDTGVDPSHPDLQLTSAWERKLVDWLDFTGEGDVLTTVTVRSNRGGWVETPYGRVNLGAIPSQSGRYRLGIFYESRLAPGGPLGQDLNRNGIPGENFLVLVTDSLLPGIYDTAHVDTNGNRDFSDEVALKEFRKDAQSASFVSRPEAGRAGRVPFVVTRISATGDRVNLGFDANGHGTHVAGVAAAAGLYRGGMNGVAPGAQVMVLKALGAGGDGYWSDIALAMNHAAENGADVVLLSLTGNQEPGALWVETELMRQLAGRHGVLFVVAAGNQGPGLGTFNAPGDPAVTLSVGAYMSPDMWSTLYDYRVPAEGLWHFSATGPRTDGGLGPSTLAPGAAAASVPYWLAGGGYARFEGTSQAVPHLGGLVALVLEEARARGVDATPASFCRAVAEGSRSLAGVPPVGQGHGLAEAPGVWEALAGGGGSGLAASSADPDSLPAGLYLRGPAPGTASVRVASTDVQARRLEVSGPDWLGSDRRQLTVPAGAGRLLQLDFRPPGPGLYSGLLALDDRTTAGRDLTFPVTAIVPHSFPGGIGILNLAGELAAGAAARHYLAIAPGTHSLEVVLTVPAAAGQVRLHLLRPDGRELWASGFVGVAEDGGQPTERVTRTVRWPQAGVWELVVAGSPALSRHGLETSRYRLEVRPRGLLVDPPALFLGVGRPADPISLEVLNAYDTFVPRVVGIGLGGSTPLKTPSLHRIKSRGNAAAALPAVTSGAVYLRVELVNASQAGADLSLYLYHRDPASGLWTEIVSSATPGRADETVELYLPPPGDYLAYVEGRGFEGETTFELRQVVAEDWGQISAVDSPRRRVLGERWKLWVTVADPAGTGDHYGLVLIRDEPTGEVLAVVPVQVTAGRPALQVEVRAPPLVTGRPDWVTIQVREAATGYLVGTVLEIDGRRYSAPRGEVRVPVTPGTGPVELRVAVRDPHYQPVDARLALALGRAGATLPAAAGNDLEAYRLKMRNHLLAR